MKGTNITTQFVLQVLAVVAIGLFGLGASVQLSTGPKTTNIHSMTDAHDRASVAQFQQAEGAKVYGLSDAHERVQTAYDPRDATDRIRAAQEYMIAKVADKMSDLNDRHTPEQVQTLFLR